MLKKIRKKLQKDFTSRYGQVQKCIQFFAEELQESLQYLEERYLKLEFRISDKLEKRLENLEGKFEHLAKKVDKKRKKAKKPIKVEARVTEQAAEILRKEMAEEAQEIEKIIARTPRFVDDADLKVLHRIGPVLERKLKNVGITSLRQIAAMSLSEARELNKDIPNFSINFTRNSWRRTAAELLQDETNSVSIE